MTDRTHCDVCDSIIPADDERLSMRVWLQKGDEETPSDHLDMCRTCVAKIEPIETIWNAIVRRRLTKAGVVEVERPRRRR